MVPKSFLKNVNSNYLSKRKECPVIEEQERKRITERSQSISDFIGRNSENFNGNLEDFWVCIEAGYFVNTKDNISDLTDILGEKCLFPI